MTLPLNKTTDQAPPAVSVQPKEKVPGYIPLPPADDMHWEEGPTPTRNGGKERIWVVIPVFNRVSFTLACLYTLGRQTYRDFEVIVVDDGSTDDTLRQVRERFPWVHVLETPGDLFWTGTVNLGISHALSRGASWVMTLNNDTLCTEDFLAGMARAMPDDQSKLLGAVAISDEGDCLYGGERLSWVTDTCRQVADKLAGDERRGLHAVTHFPGRGLLVPRKALEQVGLFDERYFPHYYADYEFTHRARRAGFGIMINYDARLITYPEASGDRRLRARKTTANWYRHLFDIRGGGNLRNFLRFSLRHAPPYLLPIYIPMGITRRVLGYWLK